MTGNEIKTTYREMLELKLLGKFCDATNTDWDLAYSDLDKSVTIDDIIWSKMGLK